MKQLLPLFLILFSLHLSHAQDDVVTQDTFWTTGGGIGFDASSLTLINPKIGAGVNRIGFGGLGNLFANYKKAKMQWTNVAAVQLGVQRLGPNENPFQKNLDVLRATSRLGLKSKNEDIYYAAELDLQTILLTTYTGNLLDGPDEELLAKFLSPLTLTFAPGIDYKPNERWSFFLSPAAYKMIYVADDEIAALEVHGNDPGENTQINFGANARIIFTDKFIDERLTYTSNMSLFSNYLEDPQYVDVLWTNNASYLIFKNLSFDVLYEFFYDKDVQVQKDFNKDGIFQEGEIGDGAAHTLAFVLKYNVIF